MQQNGKRKDTIQQMYKENKTKQKTTVNQPTNQQNTYNIKILIHITKRTNTATYNGIH